MKITKIYYIVKPVLCFTNRKMRDNKPVSIALNDTSSRNR